MGSHGVGRNQWADWSKRRSLRLIERLWDWILYMDSDMRIRIPATWEEWLAGWTVSLSKMKERDFIEVDQLRMTAQKNHIFFRY